MLTESAPVVWVPVAEEDWGLAELEHPAGVE